MERDRLTRELGDADTELYVQEYEEEFFWPPAVPMAPSKSNVTGNLPTKLQEDTKPGYTAYVEIDLGIPKNPCYTGYLKKNEEKKILEFVCTGWLKGIVQKKTAIFAPSHLDSNKPIDLIIYLHGHLGAHPGIKKLNPTHSPCIREYLNYTKASYFQLREPIEASNRNAILIAPTLGPRSQYGKLADNFDAFIEQSIEAINGYIIRNRKLRGEFELGELVLAAHSGGGSPMLQILLSNSKYAKKVSEVWGFDSWYNSSKAWQQIAGKNPSLKIFGYYFSSANIPLKPARRNKRIQKKNFHSARVGFDLPGLDHFTLLPHYFKERVNAQSFLPISKTDKESTILDEEDLFSSEWEAAGQDELNWHEEMELYDGEMNSTNFESEVPEPTKTDSPFHASKFERDRSNADFFDFKRKVYEAHLDWARKGGKKFVADQPAGSLTDWKNKEDLTFEIRKGKKIYKPVTVHTRMEEPLRNLLASAKADAKAEGRDINIYISNGYRSATTQFRAWDNNFKKYYDRALSEAGLAKGDYSNSAAALLAEFIRAKLGAPGYSNHQHGRAVDFFLLEWNPQKGKKEAFEVSTKSANVSRWRKTWFWNWLVKNAARFGFCPYDKEPWHWEYWKDIDPGLERCVKKSKKAKVKKEKELDEEFFWGEMEMETAKANSRNNISCDLKRIKRTRKGYSAYGGGRLDSKLKKLRSEGKLAITDNEILLLQELARTESSGLVQAINSWDSAYMSVGFAQFTFIHKHHFPYKKIKQIADPKDLQRIEKNSPEAFTRYFDKKEEPGKLQMMIELAPDSFRKYDIELSGTIRWKDRKGKIHEVKSLKGLNKLKELRSYDWARKFYCAGLDEDIIIAQAKLVLFVLEMSLYTMQAKIGSNYFIYYYKTSAKLRGLIQEAYNNRPAYLIAALKNTSSLLSPQGKVSADRFLEVLKQEIVKQYDEKENDKAKGLRLSGKY
jgi:hypothetical protein